MLTVIQDGPGTILGVCEWWVVDELGHWNPYGRYVYVDQLQIATRYERHAVIRDVIADIAWRAPQAVGAYWERREKTGSKLHAFRRAQLVREEVSV